MTQTPIQSPLMLSSHIVILPELLSLCTSTTFTGDVNTLCCKIKAGWLLQSGQGSWWTLMAVPSLSHVVSFWEAFGIVLEEFTVHFQAHQRDWPWLHNNPDKQGKSGFWCVTTEMLYQWAFHFLLIFATQWHLRGHGDSFEFSWEYGFASIPRKVVSIHLVNRHLLGASANLSIVLD